MLGIGQYPSGQYVLIKCINKWVGYLSSRINASDYIKSIHNFACSVPSNSVAVYNFLFYVSCQENTRKCTIVKFCTFKSDKLQRYLIQLVAAVDNLVHIFTVPETINKCREYISDGKLLHAHKR